LVSPRDLGARQFWPLRLPCESLGVCWDSNSQTRSSFGSVGVHSLTLSCIPKSMKCDSWASFLAHKFCKPKVKVVTCVHVHRRICIIEGCDNPSCIQSTMEKDGENNQKVGKVSQTISQTSALRPKHDKIQTQWISNNLSKSMLERI